MSEPVKLYGSACGGLTLQQSLEAAQPTFEGKETIALLYSPRSCIFARLGGEQLHDSQGVQINLAEIFEARIFNRDAELRWLNHVAGRGRAVLLTQAEPPSVCRENLPENVSFIALKTLDQTYLVWGEGTRINSENGWSRLTTARIGRLEVPLSGIAANERVHMRVLEYLAEVDAQGKIVDAGSEPATAEEKLLRHGNVAVVEERLLYLEVA